MVEDAKSCESQESEAPQESEYICAFGKVQESEANKMINPQKLGGAYARSASEHIPEMDIDDIYNAYINMTLEDIISAFKACNNMNELFSVITTCEREYGVIETKRGILEEILQLIETNTVRFIGKDKWKALNKQGFKQVLPSTLVLKAKFDGDNVFTKVKARLVCLGNLQKFYNTLLNKSTIESPTVSMASVLIVLAIVPKKNLKIATFDIKGAFLHAPIKEEVYVRLSRDVARILIEHDSSYQEFLQDDGTLIVLLEKCLYGLRQSPRAWYIVINGIIIKLGYTPSENDTCLYVKQDANGDMSYVCLYVDDMLSAGSDDEISKFHEGLMKEFGNDSVTAHMHGDSVNFLGMKIERRNRTVKVSQQLYIENMIEDDDNLDLDTRITTPHPLNFAQDRSKDKSPKSAEVEYFRRKVMQVMYISVRTRPDVLLDVVVLAGRLANPSVDDIAILKRILIYLYQTRQSGLVFREGAWDFWACVDASFNTYENGRGHSGILMFLDKISAAVLTKSLKQKVVTGSSTQSELVSLNEGVLHILWIANILLDLLPDVPVYPIKIYNDNQSMITLVKRPVVNRQGRSKFMNRALFKVNDNVEAGEIILLYENTEHLIADFLTKALYGDRFQQFRARIMGLDTTETTKMLGSSRAEVQKNISFLIEAEKRNLIQILWLEAE
jgi:hypothetical protein